VIPPKLSKEQGHLEYNTLVVSRLKGMARQATRNKSLFIPQCCEIFRVLGRRKQHIIPHVSISFVSSVDLIPG